MFEGPEKKFQRHIAECFLLEHGYAVLEQDDITDKDWYFAEAHLLAFLQATQAETLERLAENYGSDTPNRIFKDLREELTRRPLWTIIRSGLSVRGHDLKLYFPRPRSSEGVANELCRENRITFIPELVIKDSKRPDFVLFLNGLPIITMELKHEKNQNVHDAVAQYVGRDHSDRIFQLPFLHIAADTSDVQVATDPQAETNFRWFNTGLSNQASTAGEYPVEFLYRQVLARDSLLDAIAFDLVHAPRQEATPDKPERPAYTIFPRYHQRRCVEKIALEIQGHFTTHGDVGRKCLVNHSAGSGKTLTMCWLADRLHSLYRPGSSEKMVQMVFLLTDRKALDKNIRDDMEKFSHLKGVVRYAKRSGDLGRFLRDREQIIVTTQQKFRTILNKIAGDAGLKELRVAFLIDEAHRSQEGSMATAVRLPFRVLGTGAVSEDLLMAADCGQRVYSEGNSEDEVPTLETANERSAEEPDVEDAQDQVDPQDTIANIIREADLNQLFVAFTATPSPATVQLFGPAFDTYSEAEAIQEGYLVDVAQSIISYRTLYNLHCPIVPKPEEEKLYPPGVVAKALRNIAYQDSELIQYKAEVMLRIFEEQVKPLLNGRAKAMIVATSRLAGLEYYRVMQRKLAERGATYKVLYAFSDFVHPENNKVISEHVLNGLGDAEMIEDRFEEESYRLMIVASKFQTGFDQPLLAGMFLDKAVVDRNAVQTVSRLNRCHPDKSGVVVVDFTNNATAILKAFNKYRHGVSHEPEEPNPQKCLELYAEVIGKGVFDQEDASPVLALLNDGDDAGLQSLVQTYRIRFLEKITDSEARKNFVHLLAKLVKSYHFLHSFFSLAAYLGEFVAFCEYVGPQLIKEGSVSELMRQVRATVVSKASVIYEGEVAMLQGMKKPRSGGGGGVGAPPVKKVSVQDMIAKIKEQFNIPEEEALIIREVTEEKIADASILHTVAAHKADVAFLERIYQAQLNQIIQQAYVARGRYELLGDPNYTEKGAIFDIMAYTVIQADLELAQVV
jgi:type I restriction enzyme R subunit